MRPFDGRRILLVVSGGIAAYKGVNLVRRLQEAGAGVDVVMTESSTRFVGGTTFEGITGRPVHTDLWERPMAHLELGTDVDAVVVAPATADLLARMATGRADDLASTTLLATDAPILAAPAMNSRMWEHPATRRNAEILEDRGVILVGPDDGPLAEGEVGPGRMAEPLIVQAETGRLLERRRRPASPLDGETVVVTAGPTRAPLDPVRYLGNRSSGRMGYAVAASAWRRGARVELITGPGSVPVPHGPRVTRVERSREMLEVLRSVLPGSRALVMVAAVADFEAAHEKQQKIKRGDETLEVTLQPGPDLLVETRALRRREDVFSVGFALETEDGPSRARGKLEEKGLDLVALNEAGRPETGFESPTNRLTLVAPGGRQEELPLLSKEDAADELLDRMERRLQG